MKYNVLCVSGGGMKGVSMLGALHYLEYDVNILKDIDTYVGSSIGAVICFLLNIGYSPIKIFDKVLKVDNFLNVDILNFLKFKNNYGLLDINQFLIHIEKAVIEKIGIIPTFKELYKYSEKRLVIVVTNYTKDTTEYFDFENHPDTSVLEAVKISCSLPIIFDRVTLDDNVYVDGGISDNFPIEYASKFGNVIGIRVKTSTIEDDIFSYVHKLFSIPVHKIEKMQLSKFNESNQYIKLLENELQKKGVDIQTLKDSVSHHIILNLETDAKALDSKDNKEKRMTNFCQGYECAKIEFSKYN